VFHKLPHDFVRAISQARRIVLRIDWDRGQRCVGRTRRSGHELFVLAIANGYGWLAQHQREENVMDPRWYYI
jgi:hypothetical protein